MAEPEQARVLGHLLDADRIRGRHVRRRQDAGGLPMLSSPTARDRPQGRPVSRSNTATTMRSVRVVRNTAMSSETRSRTLMLAHVQHRRSPVRVTSSIHFPTNGPRWIARSVKKLERVEGIEPSSSAWKAVALPLSYTREHFTLTARHAGWAAMDRCLVEEVGLHISSHVNALGEGAGEKPPPDIIGLFSASPAPFPAPTSKKKGRSALRRAAQV